MSRRQQLKYFQLIDNFCLRIYTSIQQSLDYQTIQRKRQIVNFMECLYSNRNQALAYICEMVEDCEETICFLRVIQEFKKKWLSGFQVLRLQLNMNVYITNSKTALYDMDGDVVMGSVIDQDGDILMEVELFQPIEIDDDLWNIL